MIQLDYKLLKNISETPGVSGFEQKIRELVMQEVKPLVDEVSLDNMGNVYAFRKGVENQKVMLAAHMDENGFIYFLPLGGFDPKTLTAQRVILHGKKDIIGVMGSKPIHLMSDEERKRNVKIEDFFIDTGMTKEELENYIEIGTPVTRERELIEMGNCFNGKSLDNRISVFVLIETLKQLKDQKLPFDLSAVFTVQEEVGIRGAQVATQKVQPDFGIAIDTTIAFDVPGSKPQEQVTRLGDGTAIKILDSTAIADYRMSKYLKETARKNSIKWQPELMSKGGTDTAMVQRMTKNGSIAGAISIPTRNIHQVIESVNKKDVSESIALLKKAVLDLNSNDWNF